MDEMITKAEYEELMSRMAALEESIEKIRNKKTFVAQSEAPDDTTILWIDTTPKKDGLKYYNGSEWVQVPVMFI